MDRSGHAGRTHPAGGGEAKPQDGRVALPQPEEPPQLGPGLWVILR